MSTQSKTCNERLFFMKCETLPHAYIVTRYFKFIIVAM